MQGESVSFNRLNAFPPSTENEILESLQTVIRSGRFINGDCNDRFASHFGEYVGARFVVNVGNGTDALTIALISAGIKSGDTVLTVANAGGYSSTAIRNVGATPRYVEISDADLLIDVELAKEMILELSEPPKAIIVTHLYGAAARIQELALFCKENSIFLIEDCAQAAGVKVNGQHVGTFGDAGTFSFYPTKNLGGFGDSGALVTNDANVAEIAQSVAQYGWSSSRYLSVRERGMNSRMDEIQAAVLLVYLPKLEAANSRRLEIFRRYCLAAPQLNFPHSGVAEFNGHLAILRTANRSRAVEALRRAGIETAIHYPVPDYRQPGFGTDVNILSRTELACEQVLSIPLFPAMSGFEVEKVCETLCGLDI